MSTIIDGSAGITYPNSTVQASAGVVLQVVSAVITAATNTTSSSLVSTVMTASITPKFSTSKILFNGAFYTRTSAAAVSISGALYRNSTNLTTGSIGCLYNYSPSNALEITSPVVFLDSPATTSATTYTIYIRSADSAGTAYIGNPNFSSVITLMEIAG